jgi:acid phosphatase
VTKLLVLVVENHSLDQMRQQMPYTAGLAEQYSYATNYRGVTYPSLPNYIAMTSGSTYGIADDGPPEEHQLNGPSVFGQAIARGKTAAVYADGMVANCDASQRAGDDYAVKHNPWVYYKPERGLCHKHDVPATQLPESISNQSLPNVGMVVPNMCHDAHDCDLSVADDWIRHLMLRVFDGPDWKSGHLAVVITADTDDRNDSNRILTVVVHPSQRHHVVHQPLDHYSLSRLYSDVVHAPALGRAASAPSLSRAFGLPLG